MHAGLLNQNCVVNAQIVNVQTENVDYAHRHTTTLPSPTDAHAQAHTCTHTCACTHIDTVIVGSFYMHTHTSL